VKDHVIPHISDKDYAYQMWKSLCSLNQSPNQNHKMVLQEKLRGTKMGKTDTITSYLLRLTQIRDGLGAVGDIVDSSELVQTTLNVFTKSREIFVHGIVAREHMPSWERLWDGFIKEEIRCGSISTSQQHGVEDGDEVDLAFVAKGKMKTKQGPKVGAKEQQSRGQGEQQKKDMSKVRCFACGELGHYAGQCPKKKKKQGGTAATTEEHEFIAQFERECAFIGCCLTIETPSSSWCANKVEEVPQIESAVSHGTRTQLWTTPFSELIGPLGKNSVSELPSRQTVGAGASEHQRLMSVSRVP
jgi:hypothetical protein